MSGGGQGGQGGGYGDGQGGQGGGLTSGGPSAIAGGTPTGGFGSGMGGYGNFMQNFGSKPGSMLFGGAQPGPVGTKQYTGDFGVMKDGSGLNTPPPAGLPPSLDGTMGGPGAGPGGLGTAYLGMPGGGFNQPIQFQQRAQQFFQSPAGQRLLNSQIGQRYLNSPFGQQMQGGGIQSLLDQFRRTR